ncbi:hypothetical protein [Corynebacterium lowii]|uniref:Uncharacterized protein n=1 Tax=Corynebacterium lowii TaxID=1544413 RepID=A0A0Q1E3J8_9CORY|nr:hypothetical protein [Corynebacterium lowii]KQB87265.1 hypothetical protein Clow_00320 [Corynebacterium lowii]MDP9852148.1 hypothetical protein [Corynebacterium lowii]
MKNTKKLTAGFAAGLCALAMGVAPAQASTVLTYEEHSNTFVSRYVMMVPTEIVVSVAEVFADGSSAPVAPEAEEAAADVLPAAEEASAGVSVADLSEGDTFASQMVELAGATIDKATSSKGRGGVVNAVTSYSNGTVLSFTKEAGADQYTLVGIEQG